MGFLDGTSVKKPTANVVSIPGSGKNPGAGKDNLPQYSCL